MTINKTFAWFGCVALMGLAVGCGESTLESAETAGADSTESENTPSSDGDGSTGSGGATETGTDTTEDGTSDSGADSGDTDGTEAGCPEAAHFLDVASAPGAGDPYDAPYLEVTCTDDTIVINTNDIPHYRFIQTTPNALVASNNTIEIPRNPVWLDEPVDIPLLGLSAVAVNGCSVFGPNEGAMPHPYGDPILNDIMDPCLGHTAFEYHYHALVQKCLMPSTMVSEPWDLPDVDPTIPSPILGYALDGYPIYGSFGCLDEACTEVVKFKSSWESAAYSNIGCQSDSECPSDYTCGLLMIDGEEVTACGAMTYAWDNNACTKASCVEAEGVYLDRCNGRFGPDGTYRYHATDTFPYVNGCYHGQANTTGGGGNRGGGGGGQGGGNQGGGQGGNGPASCASDVDCVGLCPAEAVGCTCHETANMGNRCVPSCTTDADCEGMTTPNGTSLTCNENSAVCVPGGF